MLVLDNKIFCCWPTNTATSNTCKSLGGHGLIGKTVQEAEVLPVLQALPPLITF